MRIKALQELARTMVGDGRKPNLYFVSLRGNIKTVTDDFSLAYRQWRHFQMKYGKDAQPCLEDRQWGEICGVGQNEAGQTEWIDDAFQFARVRKINIEL